MLLRSPGLANILTRLCPDVPIFLLLLQVTDGVEVWLNALAKSMKATLQGTLPGCMRAKDFKAHPSQVLNLEEMCTFTSKAESAIQRGSLPALQKELHGQLQEYTAADYTGYRVMQLKIQALVLDLIHNIEIVDQLLEAQCKVQAAPLGMHTPPPPHTQPGFQS